MSNGYGAFAAVYDELNRDFPYQEVADFYDALIRRYGAPGNILLDIGCGSGSLTFLMEQKGYDVVGIDASDEMLSLALEKKMELQSDALFLHQRMEELDMFGTMDITVSCLDCINHLENEAAVRKAFERVHLFGAPDSLFLFDCNTVYKHKDVLADRTFVYDMEEVYCVWQNTPLADNAVQMDLDLFCQTEEDGIYERLTDSFCERAYEKEKMVQLLEQTGFELLNIFDGFTFEQPKAQSQRYVFAARIKKEGTV